MRELQKFGVGATPSFFINGRFMSGAMPIDNFVADHRRGAEEGERAHPAGHAGGAVLPAVGRSTRVSRPSRRRSSSRRRSTGRAGPAPGFLVSVLGLRPWRARLRSPSATGSTSSGSRVCAGPRSPGRRRPCWSRSSCSAARCRSRRCSRVIGIGLVSNLVIEIVLLRRSPARPTRTRAPVHEWQIALDHDARHRDPHRPAVPDRRAAQPVRFLYLVQIALAAVLVRALLDLDARRAVVRRLRHPARRAPAARDPRGQPRDTARGSRSASRRRSSSTSSCASPARSPSASAS